MDVLLTGASSFVGSHAANHLLDCGHRVIGTYRTAGKTIDGLGRRSDLDLISLDLGRAEDFYKLPRAVDAIVHTAAVSVAGDAGIDAMLECNVIGTRNLLRYALSARAGRLIYMSSLSVHGDISHPVVDENTPMKIPDLYGTTKYLGERMIAGTADQLPAVAIRLPGVLGSGAHRAWLPNIVCRALSGQDVAIYNPEAPFNNAVHVDDLGRFVAQLLKADFEGFHTVPIAAKDAMSVRDVVQFLLNELGSDVAVTVTAPQQPGFTISSQSACREFGYEPQTMEDMLRRYAKDILG